MLHNKTLIYIVSTLCYYQMTRTDHNTWTKTPAILAVSGF